MNSDRGLIGFFGLTEWFDNLTPGEKQKISDYYFMPVDVSFQISVSQSNLEEDISIIELGDPTEHINNMSPRLTREGFLQLIGSNAIIVKDYDFAEKILEKALENMEIDPITRHFIYNSLIDCFYSLRNIDDKALLKCIKYCWEDIKFLNDFLIAYKKKEEQQLQWIKENLEEGEENAYLNKNLNEGIIYPGIPSLKRLAIIYEKQGKIEDAVKVCEIGIRYELSDFTKSGFEGRKVKLLKKLEGVKHTNRPVEDRYELEKKSYEIKRSKPKVQRPKVPYNSTRFNFDFNINFSLTKNKWSDMDYVNYWNSLVERLFNLINDCAGREIAFLGIRKNYPLPIVTTYMCVSENPEYAVNRLNIDLEVFTDDSCSKFVDDIYSFLSSIKPCNEISSIKISQPWLLSTSKENINRTHIETEFLINFK